MEVRAQVKAGVDDMPLNPNETLVRVQKPTQGLKVKTHIKAGVVIDFEQPNANDALGD